MGGYDRPRAARIRQRRPIRVVGRGLPRRAHGRGGSAQPPPLRVDRPLLVPPLLADHRRRARGRACRRLRSSSPSDLRDTDRCRSRAPPPRWAHSRADRAPPARRARRQRIRERTRLPRETPHHHRRRARDERGDIRHPRAHEPSLEPAARLRGRQRVRSDQQPPPLLSGRHSAHKRTTGSPSSARSSIRRPRSRSNAPGSLPPRPNTSWSAATATTRGRWCARP
jgi:hypothetical protein